jgi:hypothetical protein
MAEGRYVGTSTSALLASSTLDCNAIDVRNALPVHRLPTAREDDVTDEGDTRVATILLPDGVNEKDSTEMYEATNTTAMKTLFSMIQKGLHLLFFLMCNDNRRSNDETGEKANAGHQYSGMHPKSDTKRCNNEKQQNRES